MKEEIKIVIKNKNYSKLKDLKIYITPELKAELEGIKSDRYGNLFKSLEAVGFRGGKHLFEILKDKLGNNIKIILSHQKSKIKENKVIINYNDYRKIGTKSFFNVYRQTGLETAYKFLLNELPNITPDLNITIGKNQIEKVIKVLPESKKLTKKSRDLLVENIAKIIRKSGVDKNKLTPEVLKEITAASNQAYYKNKLEEFRKRLKKKFPETKGKNSWQSWIYSNSWIFGVNYLKPIEKKKVGFNQIPDYLFPTVDGFLDILEIKTPHESKSKNNGDIIIEDKNHPGSYYWTQRVSEAVGQVTNYLHELEKHQLEIAQKIKREYKIEVSTVKPRAIILIGRTKDWEEKKLEALRKLNFTLHGIEVISYDQLIKRAESLVEMFDKEIKTKKRGKRRK